MNKIMKKAFIVLLGATTMVSIGALNFAGSSDGIVKAASVMSAEVTLGFNPYEPEEAKSKDTPWIGSKVYFGTEENKNLWKVLSPNTGLLWADKSVSEQPYDTGGNDWNNSSIRTWLNDSNYKENTSKFTAIEQTAIDGAMVLLFDEEVNSIPFGFFKDEGNVVSRKTDQAYWVVPITSGNVVNTDGSIGTEDDSTKPLGIVPSFNLDRSKVLFTSAIGVDSSSFKKVRSENDSNNIFKLTLKDGDTAFATAPLPTTAKQGEAVKVNVTTKGSNTYNQTSAILESSTSGVVAYGKIGTSGIGEKTFTIPKDIPAGTYTLHVFEEQDYRDKKSNSASQEVTGTIKVEKAPETFDVKITAGSHMTKTATSGSINQPGLSAAMTSVVYVANDDYYFPESYKVATQNGISVNRESDRQITISGTPTGNVNLLLLAATKKDGAEEPANPGVEAPKIVFGANGVYTIGSNDGLVIKSSGALADLTGIYVDDKLVDPSNYTLKSGSTILTLKTSYLNSLSEGKHTLVFKYNDQSAETTFSISKASNTAKTPSTGDTTSVAGLITLFVIAGVGLSYYAKKRYFN